MKVAAVVGSSSSGRCFLIAICARLVGDRCVLVCCGRQLRADRGWKQFPSAAEHVKTHATSDRERPLGSARLCRLSFSKMAARRSSFVFRQHRNLCSLFFNWFDLSRVVSVFRGFAHLLLLWKKLCFFPHKLAGELEGKRKGKGKLRFSRFFKKIEKTDRRRLPVYRFIVHLKLLVFFSHTKGIVKILLCPS